MGRVLVSVSALAVVLAAFLGCETDKPADPTTSSSSSGSGGEGGMGGAGMGGMATGGSGGTSMPSSGLCRTTCTMPKDCCADPADPNCPGPDYPNNFTCTNGVCGGPQCATDADCSGFTCLAVGGVKACRTECMSAGQCGGTEDCTGVADTGEMFCKAISECMTDGDCFGYGVCVNSACVCMGNADCTAGSTACDLP